MELHERKIFIIHIIISWNNDKKLHEGDIMNLNDNLVSFPNGNWLTNDIYYNSQKDEYKVINPDAIIDSSTISTNNEITSKKLQVSNDIILYDLIKNEKEISCCNQQCT